MTPQDYIKGNEGCRLKPYKDSLGKLTIGYGCNLDDGISPTEAQMLFDSRYAVAMRDAIASVGSPAWMALDDVRKTALIDMAYELGEFRLAGFHKMLAAVRANDWQAASDECKASDYAQQVPDRAARNAQLFLTGEWP